MYSTGVRLVDRGVALLATGGCDPVAVVLGAVVTEVMGAQVVVNPDWQTGMASSLRCGLAAMPPQAEAVVVALVDQPWVGPEAVRRLVAAHRQGAVAAVAAYDGVPRNPVLLAREVWADVAATLDGDVGARPWLDSHRSEVSVVECGDTGRPDDIDTPADLPD